MKRPIYVRQDENHPDGAPATFWYTISRGNAQPTLTSETYSERSGAVRGARGTLDLLSDRYTVVFSYWTGRVGEMELRTERLR